MRLAAALLLLLLPQLPAAASGECPSGRAGGPSLEDRPAAAAAAPPETEAEAAVGPKCGRSYIPAGRFRMGSDTPDAHPADGEGPVRDVAVPRGFWLDRCEVTNAQFRRFVRARRFRTDAELYGWSFVFEQLLPPAAQAADPEAAVQAARWWRAVQRAWWRQPTGNGSSVRDLADHPVVHVSWRDAYYYCRWRGGRLPSEEEWEYAARGGLEGRTFPWGDELTPNGEHRMNVWQGRQVVAPGAAHDFHNTLEDGFLATAPVGSFPPNGYGLYDMTGNVWEWTASVFTGPRPPVMPREAPNRPDMCNAVDFRVKKGGSYLCHADYCNRYRCSARQGIENDSSTGNLGFRCAYDD